MVTPTGRLPENCPEELLKEELIIRGSILEDWYTTDFWADEEEEDEDLPDREFDWAA